MRRLRLVLRPLAGWLLLSVVIFWPPLAAAASTVASGLAVLALSFVKGTISRPYGGGWRAVLGRRPAR